MKKLITFCFCIAVYLSSFSQSVLWTRKILPHFGLAHQSIVNGIALDDQDRLYFGGNYFKVDYLAEGYYGALESDGSTAWLIKDSSDANFNCNYLAHHNKQLIICGGKKIRITDLEGDTIQQIKNGSMGLIISGDNYIFANWTTLYSTTKTGQILWSTGHSQSGHIKLCKAEAGNFIVKSGDGSLQEASMDKFTSGGESIWHRNTVGGASIDFCTDPEGNAYSLNYDGTNSLLTKYNTIGDIVWATVLGFNATAIQYSEVSSRLFVAEKVIAQKDKITLHCFETQTGKLSSSNSFTLQTNFDLIVSSGLNVTHILERGQNIYVAGFAKGDWRPQAFVAKIEAIPTGIIKTESSSFKVFPNPASGVVSVQVASTLSLGTVILICDALGRKVLQPTKVSSFEDIQIDLSEVPKGLYYISISATGKEQWNSPAAKLLIE